MNNPYADLVVELTKAFDFFNQKLLDGVLKSPIINVLPAGRKAMLGWHAKDAWKGENNKQFTEICICAEHLQRDPKDVLEVIIHEAGHLYNSQHGIEDCSPGTQWHNRKFKTAAEKLGLICTKMKGKGYAQTTLGPKALAVVEEFLVTANKDAFKIVRAPMRRSYKKMFFVNVTENDKEKIQSLVQEQGFRSEKEVISWLIEKNI